VSSFIAKGMIDFLLNNTEVAKALRDKFIFKIIPMMNPDGVIHGNYRTSLSGRDLNRRWSKTSKDFEPEIFNIKEYIRELSQKYEIVLVCDLHGHSRKKDVFAYACMDSNNRYRTR
jgi:murein tripeptide amidase MpaA